MAKGMPKTTIRMPASMEDTVDDMVENGPYTSKSEVVRDALRPLVSDWDGQGGQR